MRQHLFSGRRRYEAVRRPKTAVPVAGLESINSKFFYGCPDRLHCRTSHIKDCVPSDYGFVELRRENSQSLTRKPNSSRHTQTSQGNPKSKHLNSNPAPTLLNPEPRTDGANPTTMAMTLKIITSNPTTSLYYARLRCLKPQRPTVFPKKSSPGTPKASQIVLNSSRHSFASQACWVPRR